MAEQGFEQLYKELLEKKDDASAKQFVRDHFNEFPEEMRSEIIASLISEALDEKLSEESGIATLQEEIKHAFARMDKEEAALEKRDALLALKEEIKRTK